MPKSSSRTALNVLEPVVPQVAVPHPPRRSIRRALLGVALVALLGASSSTAQNEAGGVTPHPEQPGAALTAAAESRPTPVRAPAAKRSKSPSHGPKKRAAPPPPVVRPVPAPPRDLEDLSAWLRYKANSQRPALPEEARLFYRRGLVAWQSGQRAEAVRLLRGAAELDPTFNAPHTVLLSWLLPHDASQALLEAAALFQGFGESFAFQVGLLANGLFVVIQSLFFGILVAGLLVVVLRNAELRHGWQESLSRFLSPRAARRWPWVFLVLPFLVGLGVGWPTVVLLALLWPSLKLRERSLFVVLLISLVAAPWVGRQMSRLAAPLAADRGPFHGVLALQTESPEPMLRERVALLTEQNPDDPLLHFGRAWLSRQAHDLGEAEILYRRTVELAPGNDRAWNNLGNVLALQGRLEEAVDVYRKATQVNPGNAAAFFNLSQTYMQRFDYQAANDAMARASALNFDLLRRRQEQPTEDGRVLLVDQWLAPELFWDRLLREPPPVDAIALPPAWRNRVEFSSWKFSILTLLGVLVALVLGLLQHRAIPLRHCSNCDRVVCRRCAERRRELALCASCAATEARAEVPDFARVLLGEHRRKTQRAGRLVRTALALLIPGYGLLALRRVFTPVMLLTFTALLFLLGTGRSTPYAYQPLFDPASREISLLVPLAAWALIYVISIAGYFNELGRADARSIPIARAQRPRPTPRRYAAAA